MIDCSYCGRANEENLTQCTECGTDLPNKAEDLAHKEKRRVRERVVATGSRAAWTYEPSLFRFRLGWRLVFAAFLAYAFAIALMLRAWHFQRTALPARASVIEAHTSKSTKGRKSHFITILFRDRADVEHRVRLKLFSKIQRYGNGDTVPVLYAADNPRAVRIQSFEETWGDPIEKLFWATVYWPIALLLLHWRKVFARVVIR